VHRGDARAVCLDRSPIPVSNFGHSGFRVWSLDGGARGQSGALGGEEGEDLIERPAIKEPATDDG